MTCPRCDGPMTYETFCGPAWSYPGWRCIFCGEVIDPVIMLNRAWRQATVDRERNQDNIS